MAIRQIPSEYSRRKFLTTVTLCSTGATFSATGAQAHSHQSQRQTTSTLDSPEFAWETTTDTSDAVEHNVTDIILADGGGAVVVGERKTFSEDRNGWLAKIGQDGSLQWQTTIDNDGKDESVGSIVETADGDFVLTGETASTFRETIDGLVVKTDSNGSIQWQATVDNDGNDDLFSNIVASTDGSHILSGTTAPDDGDQSVLLAKLDSNGGVEWQKVFGTDNNYNFPFHLVATGDGGAILTVETGFLYADGCVVKLSGDGGIEWETTFEQEDNLSVTITGVVNNDDDTVLVVGTTGPISIGANSTTWMAQINNEGHVEWQNTYDTDTPPISITDMVETNDGGVILVGHTTPEDGKELAWAARIDSTGTEQWRQTFGKYEYGNTFHKGLMTDDGSVILAGRAYPGKDKLTGLLVKTNGRGSIQWDTTIDTAVTILELFEFVAVDGANILLTGSTDAGEAWISKLRENQRGGADTVPVLTDSARVTDPDGDGYYEDTNGDNSTDLLDVRVLFEQRNSDVVANHADLFDFSQDGTFDLLDIRTLFQKLR
jgi:hypothetical protein